MDKRNPFERQLADEIEYEVGPPQNVDALAITQQAKSTSPRWRFFPMSSAIKITAAAAVLATAGAAFLVVVPDGLMPDGGVTAPPGADAPSASPSLEPEDLAEEPFAGSLAPFDLSYGGEPETVGPGTFDDSIPGRIVQAGITQTGGRIDSLDPRVAGMDITVENGATLGDPESAAPPFGEDETKPPPEILSVRSIARQITNEGGSWSGSGHEVEYASDDGENFIITSLEFLHGEGEYEGLTLILMSTGEEQQGWIVPADAVQPIPELPAE